VFAGTLDTLAPRLSDLEALAQTGWTTPVRRSPTAMRLGPAATGTTIPAARLVFRLHPAPVFRDPRLSVGFGGERADLGRKALRDAYFDGERPVVNRDHAIGRLGVGVGPLCHWPTIGFAVQSAYYEHWRARKVLCVLRVPNGHLACPHGVRCSPAPVRGAAANSEDLNLISCPDSRDGLCLALAQPACRLGAVRAPLRLVPGFGG